MIIYIKLCIKYILMFLFMKQWN